MSVDLPRLSLRYWMPAMNPFTPSSKQSSIIIALFQHSGSDKGGWGEFCLPAGEPLWVRFTEGMKYYPGSPVLCALDFMKSGLMMTRHCIAIYTLVREYFTTLKSYHRRSNLLLRLNACEVNNRISSTPHRTYGATRFCPISIHPQPMIFKSTLVPSAVVGSCAVYDASEWNARKMF